MTVVEEVRASVVSLPHRKPIVTPVERESFPHAGVDCVVAEIRTQDGIEGLGVAWTIGREKAMVIKAMVHALTPLVVGEDPTMTERVWSKMWRHTNTIGHAGISLIGMSAIDLALWDIRGKMAGLPVYKLLGGHDSELPAYASGMFLSSSLDEVVEEAKAYVDAGFIALKMRVGLRRLADDVERVAAVRNAVGSDVKVAVDAAQGWDTIGALRACRALTPFDLLWVEDPVVFDNVDGLAALVASVETPITVGEKLFSRYEFRELLERRAVNVVMPDIQRVGGVTEWMKIAALAQAWNLPITGHGMPDISSHLLAAVPNAIILEYLSWWEPLFADPNEPNEKGTVIMRDLPGFGIELNQETIERYGRG